jgi:uncharacterized protein (DUF488 family)
MAKSLNLSPLEAVPILTLGYGKRTLSEFIGIVEQHSIGFIIDVRSSPFSRFQPDFSKQVLAEHLRARGIRYVFMGDSLGGRPDDQSCYVNGHVAYDLVRERSFFKAGIDRLQNAVKGGYRVCLLCAELHPEECHRSKLIGVTLVELGFQVIHICGDGALSSQSEVLSRLKNDQPELFAVGLSSRKVYVNDGRRKPSAK